MHSMTGFGRGVAQIDSLSVSLDLKTVNNRFLDIHLRSQSSDIASVETAIRRRISDRLARGRVDVTLNVDRPAVAEFQLNRPLIVGFLKAMRELKADYELGGELDVNLIARLPNAVLSVTPRPSAPTDADNPLLTGVLQALDAALDELQTMREQEGAALAAEMDTHLTTIEQHIAPLEQMAATLPDLYRQKLEKRVTDLLTRTATTVGELDQARLAQEVAYLAERSDITEELARLRSHLAQFRETLTATGEIGKRLDFLTQELNREANTVLSKSSDIAIKEAGLAIKTAVEKLREQVQNVE